MPRGSELSGQPAPSGASGGKKKETVRVIFQEEISPGIFSMKLAVGRIAREAVPGQFVSLFCRDLSRLLPRPISICETGPEEGWIRLVYRVAGAGTREFSALRAGDALDVMGPLGNGFTAPAFYPVLFGAQGEDGAETASGMPVADGVSGLAPDTERTITLPGRSLLIGGGIGIPPLLELAKRIEGEKTIILGYRDVLFLKEEFEPWGEVLTATEDGSAGVKGTVLDCIRSCGVKGDRIFACGPTPMLRALKEFAGEGGIPCLLSLEQRMACGIGACLACVCASTETDAHSQVKNKRICAEGPVFPAEDLDL